MLFLRLNEVPLEKLTVFRVFPLSSAILVLVLLVSIPALAAQTTQKPLLWYVLIILAILLLFGVNDLRKALKPTAWLAALGNGKLYLKWRSYQNAHWGMDEVQAVEIALREIHQVSRISGWSDSKTDSRRLNFIELKLSKGTDTKELANHLAYRPANKSIWGCYPVTLHDNHKLLIEWRAHPGGKHFLRLLNSHGIPTVSSDTRPQATDLIALIREIREADPTVSLAEAKVKAEQMIRESKPRSER